MATINITASLQGTVSKYNSNTSSWSADRNATTGTSASTYTASTTDNIALHTAFTKTKPATTTIERTFLFFDTSTVLGTITAADLKIKGAGPYVNSLDSIAVEGTAWGGNGTTTTLSTLDYSSLVFTGYSASITSWITTGYNAFEPLNASAISDMNANSYLNVAVIEYNYDYLNVLPPSNTNDRAGILFQDSTDPIILVITYTPTPVYGNEVNGIPANKYVAVNPVSKADISNVNGA